MLIQLLLRYLTYILCILWAGVANTQETTSAYLPDVFQIGEYTEAYESLHMNHLNLMEVCDDDMQLAFGRWMHMLNAIDAHSEDLGVDLKGVKLWIHVFWDQQGNIKHLAFHPKPTSKFMNINELTALFKNFVKDYKLPLQAEMDYTHYGSAEFPTLATRLALKENKN